MLRNVTINDASLKVYQSERNPAKPVIVFLHDSLGCIRLWRDLPDHIADATGCSILVYDRQGYGESSPFSAAPRDNDYMAKEADVLYELLHACGISNAILYGHSDGGTIALIAAAKYPDLVKGVITEGAHIFVEEVTLAGIRKTIEEYNTTDLKQRLQKYHGDKAESIFMAWATIWQKEEYRNWNISYLMPGIVCPVLAVQGELDEYGSIAQVHGIIDHITGPGTALMIPGIGHSPHKDAREQVLKGMIPFINTIAEHNKNTRIA